MYNRYIPNGATYTRVTEDDRPPQQSRGNFGGHQPPQRSDRESHHAQQASQNGGNTGTHRHQQEPRREESRRPQPQNQTENRPPHQQPPEAQAGPRRPPPPKNDGVQQPPNIGGFTLPPFLFGKGKDEGGFSSLLRSFKLDNLDSGDILLLLIVLFLLVEGDNLELVIALGLVLIMGLGDDEKKDD